jgi:hypothetical protein
VVQVSGQTFDHRANDFAIVHHRSDRHHRYLHRRPIPPFKGLVFTAIRFVCEDARKQFRSLGLAVPR